MVTTVRSSELDFFKIKESLKLFLQQEQEFEDYDFEGSALSNLLDVLSNNTHINALIANFALNESYLTTAQLRNSVVSLAESLGYIPSSKSSAQSTISLSINLSGVANLESSYSLLPGELVLRGSVDDVDFTFTNRETIIGTTSGGSGIYNFTTFEDGNSDIQVYEGEERQYEYLVDNGDNSVYVIPDQNIDTSTAIVRLYENQTSSSASQGSYKVFNNVFEASTIDASSRLYILRESPNRFYELTFGNNNSLGETPVAGNVVSINYLRTSGKDANGVGTLRLSKTINFGSYEVQTSDVTAVVQTRSSGGDDAEEIESIRKRAPFQYAAQNRMVTPLDYEALILRKYSNYIEDIICWGGEDDVRKDYGAVYVSIVWKADLSSTTIGQLREELLELTKDLSIVSFQLKFIAPSKTWVSSSLSYQFNPTLSGNSKSSVNALITSTVQDYFKDNVGKFQQVFRRSNLLTEVDNTDPSVLSSRLSVQLQKRINPILTLSENHKLIFPSSLEEPSSIDVPVIRTSLFKSNNKSVFIRNKLTDRVKVSPAGRVPIVFDRLPSTKLEMVDVDGNIVISEVGYYEPSTGVVEILALNVQNTLNSNNYIKVFATPANQSVTESTNGNLLEYDETESVVKAVVVSSKV